MPPADGDDQSTLDSGGTNVDVSPGADTGEGTSDVDDSGVNADTYVGSEDSSMGSFDVSPGADTGGGTSDVDDTGINADTYVGSDAGSEDSSMGSFDVSPGADTGGGTSDVGVADVAEVGAPSTGLSVLYQVQQSAAMSAYIGCELSVVNAGSTPVAVSGLEARYYYTGEDSADVHVTPQMTINWAHVVTSGADTNLTVTYAFVPLQPAAAGADTYVAFDFSSGHSMLGPGESAVFSWQLQGPDPATDVFDQTSDYSFNASMTALTSWGHVVLTQSGSVAWGTPP